ncbi:MAG: hypothetical protein LBT26_08400 [Clostridiales Family XIII bacterium]|nr:hypothetical protein [Clostridiales Family XIII bacterium]
MDYVRKWTLQGANIDARACGASHFVTKRQKPDGIVSYKNCPAVGHMLTKANGDIWISCCESAVPVIGNIIRDGLFSALTGNSFLKLENAFDNLAIKDLPEICVNCGSMHTYDSHQLTTQRAEKFSNGKTIDDCHGFEHNSLGNFHKTCAGKRVFIFGAWHQTPAVIDRICKNIRPLWIVDNNPSIHGKELSGLPIKAVDSLKKFAPDDVVVLIAMQYINEAEKQLREIGIKRYFAGVFQGKFWILRSERNEL